MLVERFLEDSARTRPHKTALVCGASRYSYEELNRMAEGFARGLEIERGERVAICLDNGVECVVAFFGALKAGGVAMMLNPSTKASKLARLLEDSEASCLVVSEAKLAAVLGVVEQAPALRNVITPDLAANLDAALAARASSVAVSTSGAAPWNPASLRGPQGHIDVDLALLLYTSGSTGDPKGVMHAHQGLTSVTRSIVEYLELGADDVVLQVLPLSFGYGLTQLLTTFAVGATLVLERSFAFPQSTLQKIAVERATCFAMVPTVAAMLAQIDLAQHDLTSLRILTNAGAGLPVELLRKLREKLPRVRVVPMYGQTECIRATWMPHEALDERPSSCGIAIPNGEVWLVDEQGRRLPNGSKGELVVRGAHVMRGYWRQPELTKTKLLPGPLPGERVLHTGDIFCSDDDGFLTFVARKDDIIKTRGEKVSPREVEEVLYALAGVVEAAVVGAPDALLGEAVRAFVVGDVDERAVLVHCAAHLEDYAVPKRVVIVDALPKTPNGKIDRLTLRNGGNE